MPPVPKSSPQAWGEEVGIQYPFPQGPTILTSDLQVGESLYRDSDAEKQRRKGDDEVTLRHPRSWSRDSMKLSRSFARPV